MLKIAVCDDNATYRNEMMLMLETWGKENDLELEVLPFSHGDALFDAHKNNKYDIIFLDIMMPLLNGMDTAKEIRKIDAVVKIIFFTSTPEFAVESYDVQAAGYLLKPLQQEKIYQTLTNCMQLLKAEPEHIIAKTIHGYQKIYLHHVEFIEAQNKRVKISFKDGTRMEAWDTFSHFADILPVQKGFFKCHRSYIVYMPNIDQFNTAEIVTKSGANIPIARGYNKAFKEAYFNYMFRKGK